MDHVQAGYVRMESRMEWLVWHIGQRACACIVLIYILCSNCSHSHIDQLTLFTAHPMVTPVLPIRDRSSSPILPVALKTSFVPLSVLTKWLWSETLTRFLFSQLQPEFLQHLLFLSQTTRLCRLKKKSIYYSKGISTGIALLTQYCTGRITLENRSALWCGT